MRQEFRYYQCGDYFIPDIQLSPYKHKVLGKYGRMRRAWRRCDPEKCNGIFITRVFRGKRLT